MDYLSPDVIQAGHSVIIQMPSGTSKIIKLTPASQISLGKYGNFKSDDLIGRYYALEDLQFKVCI